MSEKKSLLRQKGTGFGINETVLEMWMGIALFSVLSLAIGLIFVKNRGAYALGIFLGAALALFSTWHIWYMLDSSLAGDDEKRAARRVGGGYLIRYLILIILIAGLSLSKAGNPIAAFVGYFCMKPAAYLQPRLHNFFDRKRNEALKGR